MAGEEDRLEALKARMTESQRKDMAEIIRKEMERRGMATGKKPAVSKSAISGSLSADQVKELYGDVGQAIQQLRTKKLEEKLAMAKKATRPSARPTIKMPSFRFSMPGLSAPSLLIYGVVGLGIAKIMLSSGAVDASTPSLPAMTSEPVKQVIVDTPRATTTIANVGGWSAVEKEILTQLDSRRVELEKRKESLDRREAELKTQARLLAERLSDLRMTSAKLNEVKKQKEKENQSRLEQLANVYGSMQPNEAATLMASLDEETAMELLERMPERRIGQILPFMEKQRAVQLTRLLTSRQVRQ